MKYSPEKTQEICKRLEVGLGRTDACILSDISYETFTQWMKKPEFSENIKKSEIKCKERNISIIQKAAITTWTAAAWWLERKHADEFAQRTHQQISGYLERGEGEADLKAQKERVSKRMNEMVEESKISSVISQSTNGNGLGK